MMRARPTTGHLLRFVLIACAVLVTASCAIDPTLTRARELSSQGRHTEAASLLAEAMKTSPRDERLPLERVRQRDLAMSSALESFSQALAQDKLADARRALEDATQIDGGNARIEQLRDRLENAERARSLLERARAALKADRAAEARVLARQAAEADPWYAPARTLVGQLAISPTEVPALAEALKKPVTLEFRDTSLRNVFEAMARMANLNFVFDRDVRGESKINVFLRNVSLDEAVRTILQTQGLDMRRLNEMTYLIFPNLAAKTREYVPLEARAFYLSNVDVKQAQAMIRAIVKSRDLFIDEKLNMMIIKDTPEAIKLAASLIRSIDVVEPEVVLEIEVMEITDSRLRELGIKFPTQIGFGLNPNNVVTNANGVTNALTVVTRDNWREQIAQTASPSLIANLRATDGATNLLSNPRIRVRNKEKAKIQVGEKVPVFTTSFAGTGISAGTALGASTTYIDVGLKVELEPLVHQESEVGIKVQLEVSSILDTVIGPAQTTAYRIGTRQAQTSLRLRDGETQVLAGLIQDQDRRSAQRVPVLGEIPILGKLFSSELGSRDKSEIILLITPRIVRALERDREFESSIAAGTDAAAGAVPIKLSANAITSISTAGFGGRGTAARTAPVAADNDPSSAGLPAALATMTAQQQPAAPQLTLDVPTRAKPGEEIVVSINLNDPDARPGAIAEVSYDSSVLAVPSAVGLGDPGRAIVTLQGAGSQTGELRLRANPGGEKTGVVSIVSFKAMRMDGSEAGNITLPSPISVMVKP